MMTKRFQVRAFAVAVAALFVMTGAALAQKEVSGDGTTEVKVAFRNSLDKAVQSIWIDFEGNEKDYGMIEPGATVTMDTYNTHLWVFKAGGRVIAKYRAAANANQTFEIKPLAPRSTRQPPPAPMPNPKPNPAPAAGNETGSALTAQEAQDLVGYHNLVRKAVNVGPVTWSQTIAKYSQEWADQIATTGKFEHRPRTGQFAQKYGENLAAGMGSGYGVMKGAADWHGEVKFYEPGTPIPADFSGFKAGHYTQMVWAKTTEIGAGKAVIKHGAMKGWTIIVCNYNPPGNVVGAKPY